MPGVLFSVHVGLYCPSLKLPFHLSQELWCVIELIQGCFREAPLEIGAK